MSTQTSQPPNVIVFFTDQQRWDTTGVHGNPLELTPNFDRVAKRGTHLAHSFKCQPVCGPARSSMQTGIYGTTTGCFRNAIPLPQDAHTLAHYFRDAGYTTGYIGKWHLANTDPVPQVERGGYEYWLAANLLEFTSDAYYTEVYDNDCRPVYLPGYRADALTDAATRYIDTHQKNPFFLFMSFLEPHHQNHRDDYPAPEGYAERYTGRWLPPDLATLGGSSQAQIGGYYGMVKRVDEAFGRLLDALQSLGLRDNTIVLFTSDHGCHFKTRNSEYKRSCHESSIRVPTALCGAEFDGGGEIRELISLIDLPPTLLDAAGIAVPSVMQGRSIMPLLRNRQEPWPNAMFLQISETQVGRAIRTKRWKYSVEAPDGNGWSDPSSSHYAETFLYDLMADPYELTNLVGISAFREIAQKLREQLIDQIVKAGEEKPIITEASTLPSGQRSVEIAYIE